MEGTVEAYIFDVHSKLMEHARCQNEHGFISYIFCWSRLCTVVIQSLFLMSTGRVVQILISEMLLILQTALIVCSNVYNFYIWKSLSIILPKFFFNSLRRQAAVFRFTHSGELLLINQSRAKRKRFWMYSNDCLCILYNNRPCTVYFL